MQEFAGKVAVVTGAASGIGRGMAERFGGEGMRLVLADVETEPLRIAEVELRESGAEVLAVRTDVSDPASVEALARAAIERFGRVHVLCNNAGVSGGGRGPAAIWEISDKEWSWVLGVNMMGVMNGLRAFVPHMLEHGEEGHIVNTASILGLVSGPGSAYGVSKHAVVCITEGLYYDLQARGAAIGCSVLCPGMIATNILHADRNQPPELRDEVDEATRGEAAARRAEMHALFSARGMPPEEAGDIVLDAIRAERFYIFTHEQNRKGVRLRFEDIMEDRQPSMRPMLA